MWETCWQNSWLQTTISAHTLYFNKLICHPPVNYYTLIFWCYVTHNENAPTVQTCYSLLEKDELHMISQGYSTKCYDIWNSLYDNPVGQSKRGHRWTQNGHETMTIILRCWIWGRLGPGNFGCSAYTWTHLSSSNKIQRNWMRLSVTVCTGRGDKFWTKNTKRAKNSTATFEKSRAKAGYCSCPLHTIPSKGWVDHLSPPLAWSLDTTQPSLQVRNELAIPSPRECTSKGNWPLFSLPPAAAGAPLKPCLNLSGL